MSWYLDSNNKLTHDALPVTLPGGFNNPYPATFWRLDSNNILTLNSEDWQPFQEPIYDILTSPYPATMWYLDENNKLKNALLPDELKTPSVYAGDVKVRNIYIGDQLVQSQYIGEILLQLEED